jgi:hypothetical protein
MLAAVSCEQSPSVCFKKPASLPCKEEKPVRLRGLRKGVIAALTVHRPFSLNAKVDSLKKFHHP